MNPLIRKLERFAKLSGDDHAALNAMAAHRVRQRPARRDIIQEGDRPLHVNLILEGWACRYKLLNDGRRQIVALFLPGDLCDLHVYVLRQMDHSIGTITPVTYAEIPRATFEETVEGRPRVMQAMWWDTLVTSAIQREWTTDIGQRSAVERLAHLLLELFYRLEAVGLTRGDECDLPLVQADLADAMGLTAVHANRMLQELRSSNLISLSGKRLVILDRQRLAQVAQFNPNYLHLDNEGSHLAANG